MINPLNAIEIDNVWKRYTRDAEVAKRARRGSVRDADDPGPGQFWALRDVSVNVKRGEVVGLIGANGAGKSTLLKIISRIAAPTRGSVRVGGSIVSLLEVGTGFHDELSGRENIKLNATILGMSDEELRARFDDIVEFSGIERFLDMPVKHLSSGMRVRLGFAVAVHVAPDVLIVDEVLAVGDAEFQEKCRDKVAELVRAHERTVLIVSHSMGSIDGLCSRALLLEEGRLTRDGDPSDVIDAYLAVSDAARRLKLRSPEEQAEFDWRASEKAARRAEAEQRAVLKRQAVKQALLEKDQARQERLAAKAAAHAKQAPAHGASPIADAQPGGEVVKGADGGRIGAVDAVFMRPIPLGPGAWDLERRVDRAGSGVILLKRLTVLGADGGPLAQPRAGAPVRFVVAYSALPEAIGLRAAAFSIVILDARNEPIFWLPSSAAHGEKITLSQQGEIACALPELPLLPGKYGVNLWVQFEGARADKVFDAAILEVAASHYFETGALQRNRNGSVLVRQTWSLSGDADARVRTSDTTNSG